MIISAERRAKICRVRGRNGGQTWPRLRQMAGKDGRDGDKWRVRMAEEGTNGGQTWPRRGQMAGKDG